MKHLFVLISISFLLLAGCGTAGPTNTPAPTPSPTPGCDPVRAQTFLDKLDPIVEEWDDANSLAGSTGRISLSPIIQNMQDIKRRVGELNTAGTCVEVEELKTTAVKYMGLIIDGYLLFMAQKPDSEVSVKFNAASTVLDRFSEKYAAVKAYIP